MSETLANNITRRNQAPHDFKIYTGDQADQQGDEVTEAYPVSQILIVKPANKIAFAKIVIGDGAVAQQDFNISNEEVFKPGKYIEIEMGDANHKELAFKGVIVKHGIRIKKNKNSVLHIDCRDVATKMTTQMRSRYFPEDASEKDACSQIIEEYNQDSPIIEDGLNGLETTHETLVQYDSTDWDFILKRANAEGQLLYTDNGKLSSVTPTVKDEADYTLEYGEIIEEFEAEMDARNQYEEVKLSVWDSSKQEIINEPFEKPADIKLETPGDISNSDLAKVTNSEGLLVDYPGAMISDDQKNLVKAEWIKSQLARIRGRVSFTEATLVSPGSTIELKGVGNRFNGRTFVTGTRHEFTNNTWITDLQFGLDRDWNREALDNPGDLGRIPVMSGLHIGVVTRLDDEKGEDRVKVRIPVIDAQGEGVWARMARQDAGEHRGTFHLPELKDEVLVSFLNCDPRYPMIMGMLNSSAKPAPVKAKSEDNLKGYYSKIGSRLEFDDKKRTVKMQSLNADESGDLAKLRESEPELEKNNTIFLDDENGEILIQDKNKNYIKLSASEVTIYGENKITLQSKEISIKADQKLETDAGNSTFKSSMETKIQGSIINLNP